MLHLLRSAIDPSLSLQTCLANWAEISLKLREPPRKRGLQLEKFDAERALLS